MRGWQPQKEMFFIWKKWLQCWNWSQGQRPVRQASSGAPAGQPRQARPPPCASAPAPHLRPTTQAQLDAPKRNLEVTGGRGAQVDSQFPGSGDLGEPEEKGGVSGAARHWNVLVWVAGSRGLFWSAWTRVLAFPRSRHRRSPLCTQPPWASFPSCSQDHALPPAQPALPVPVAWTGGQGEGCLFNHRTPDELLITSRPLSP